VAVRGNDAGQGMSKIYCSGNILPLYCTISGSGSGYCQIFENSAILFIAKMVNNIVQYIVMVNVY
jgi:hypothetical protein